MAHLDQKEFCIRVKNKFPQFFHNKKVLDIGSLDVNGSNKDLFTDCNYLGIDVGSGKNVDLIAVGHLFDGPSNYFDTIISTEVFEHDMYYEETFKNIMRMLKPGGLFLFTCAAPPRPEHGTRRCGEDCAPLLKQISEEWADYYKNLTEKDIRVIPNFNQTFPDCYFEHKVTGMIQGLPGDLYFYGIKEGEKYLVDSSTIAYSKETFEDHVFVVDCWPDNQDRENDLISCIKQLKTFNITIVLVGHYPVKPEIQRMVDYYIFDKENPLLMSSELSEYNVYSGRWTILNGNKIENIQRFHHDYAIWETMRNAFNFCNFLGKKYIHFLEYDNIPNVYQYRQSFVERIKDFDAILYEYELDSVRQNNLDSYCSTYIFSIRTDIAIKITAGIKNKKDFFTNRPQGWQLERQFFRELKKHTSNILVADYIANDNELNTQSAWNRDGMVRNGSYFQPYICADENQNLYLHLIHGFYTKKPKDEYLIEVEYDDYKKFIVLQKDKMRVDLIGKYQKGKRVKLFIYGVEVFNEFLGEDFETFYKHERITPEVERPVNQNISSNRKINVNYIDGPFIEIQDDVDLNYKVEFVDVKTNKVYHTTNLRSNHWAKASVSYFVDWVIRVKGLDNDYNDQFYLDPENKKFLVSFESGSLGDNLAWIASVEEFRIKNKCSVVCSTFFNELFKPQYPSIEFVAPGTTVHNVYGLYRIGLFFDSDNKINLNRHPTNPLRLPLMQISSDILGLEYRELKPKLGLPTKNKVKRVCIAIHSTSQCKYWNNPSGWQDVVDYLRSSGYEVRLLSREEDGFMGNKNPTGVTQQKRSSITQIADVINESELFIGISSGLSWLAWALGVPTVIISGFTDKYLEPTIGVKRIINKSVCNGCWHEHEFDKKDWNWCPKHKGTDRQFECTKEITSQDVIKAIQEYIN